MGKSRRNAGGRHGLQVVTLCISTAMVLVLLGIVVLFTLSGRNLSSWVRENFVVTMVLDHDMTDGEALSLMTTLRTRPFVNQLHYISQQEALREGKQQLGVDPTEFAGGNPFNASIDITLKADYANNDSLQWISKELRACPQAVKVSYEKDLIEKVNRNIANLSVVFLVIALLLTIVSFSLINNTVKLGIYARRFTMHTMKLVGASWGFIRWPFVRSAIGIGLLAAIIASAVLGGCIYGLYVWEPDMQTFVTWKEMTIVGVTVFAFGIIITGICASVSVTKFLRMKASDLYKI